MKRLGKWLMKRQGVQWLVVTLLVGWLRFVHATSQKTYDIPDATKPYLRGDKQAVFSFWHGRMIMHPFIKPNRDVWALTSRHRDGGLIGAVLERFDITPVRGSSNRGGAEAIREMKQVAASGATICITPDGPRGPAHMAAPGIAYLACATGLPIICSAFSSSHAKRFKSWDRFMMPLPFGHIYYALSKPMTPDMARIEDRKYIAELSEKLSEQTNRMMRSCDGQAGVAA